MSRIRVHIPAERWVDCLVLDAAERHHLVDVLRLRPGSQVEIFDGVSTVCQAILLYEEKNWLLRLGPRRNRPEQGPTVCLGVALLKGKKLDQVVRMATEIGVSVIQPFTSSRSVSRPDRKRLEERVRRWRTIASQAARQSSRSCIPCVEPCQSLDEVLQGSSATDRAILHETASGPTLSEWLLGIKEPAERLVLVGPEGGFTSREIDRACDAGFKAVGLGLPVLRAETAALVAAAFSCSSPRQATKNGG